MTNLISRYHLNNKSIFAVILGSVCLQLSYVLAVSFSFSFIFLFFILFSFFNFFLTFSVHFWCFYFFVHLYFFFSYLLFFLSIRDMKVNLYKLYFLFLNFLLSNQTSWWKTKNFSILSLFSILPFSSLQPNGPFKEKEKMGPSYNRD